MSVFRWCLGLAVFVGAGAVAAQSSNSPLTTILLHGVQLRQQGQDEAALAEFRRADQLSHEPRITAQIGLAEQALQRWVDASRHLREALLSSQDAYIVRHRAELEPALAEVERHLGAVVVTGGVQGAEVWSDGTLLGVLPMNEPVRALQGLRSIEVRAPGYETAHESVRVDVAAVARLVVSLRPSPVERPRVSDTMTPPPLGAVRPSSARRTSGWITLFGGLGVGAVGGVGLWLWQSNVGSFNDAGCYVDETGAQVGGGRNLPPGQCRTYMSTASTWQTVAFAGLAAGAASMIVGTVLLATSPSRATSGGQVVLRGCSLGTAPLGVTCTGAF